MGAGVHRESSEGAAVFDASSFPRERLGKRGAGKGSPFNLETNQKGMRERSTVSHAPGTSLRRHHSGSTLPFSEPRTAGKGTGWRRRATVSGGGGGPCPSAATGHTGGGLAPPWYMGGVSLKSVYNIYLYSVYIYIYIYISIYRSMYTYCTGLRQLCSCLVSGSGSSSLRVRMCSLGI